MGEILYRKRERKDKTVWEYRFEIARIDGKRKWISQSNFRTKKEAIVAAQHALMLYENNGMTVLPSTISFADYLDYWIVEDCERTIKPVTIDGYKKKIRLYIKPSLGKYRLKSLTTQAIKDFLVDMYDKGFSKNTISACKGIISKSLDFAVDIKLLPVSPAVHIKTVTKGGRPPKKATRTAPHVYLPKDTMAQIFQRFPEGTPNHVALMIGYHTGLRLSEIFGLTWEDIDFDKGTLQVNRQIQWQPDKTRSKKDKALDNGTTTCGDGYWYFCEPKYESYREIEIDDELLSLLKREKEQMERAKAYYGNAYPKYYVEYPLTYGGKKPLSQQVFNRLYDTPSDTPSKDYHEVHFVTIRENGTYMSPRTTQYTSSVIHHKLGFPEFDFHSLRHTHATMLKEMNAPDIYIQKRLGHAKIEVTINIYENHLTDIIRDAGNTALGNVFPVSS